MIKNTIAKKQYQKLNDTYECDKIIKKEEKPTVSTGFKDVIVLKILIVSLTSKYSILLSFYSNLNKFNNVNPQQESTKEKSDCVW